MVLVTGDRKLASGLLGYAASLGLATVLVCERPLAPKHRGMVPFRWADLATAAPFDCCRAVLSWEPAALAPLTPEERHLLARFRQTAAVKGAEDGREAIGVAAGGVVMGRGLGSDGYSASDVGMVAPQHSIAVSPGCVTECWVNPSPRAWLANGG